MAVTKSPNREVLEAVRLLVGDMIERKPYVMLSQEPGEGDRVIGRFRTISDAMRHAKRNHLGEISLWTQVKIKRKQPARPARAEKKEELAEEGLAEEELTDEPGEEAPFEETDGGALDELDDLLGDSELPDLDEDANLDDLL